MSQTLPIQRLFSSPSHRGEDLLSLAKLSLGAVPGAEDEERHPAELCLAGDLMQIPNTSGALTAFTAPACSTHASTKGQLHSKAPISSTFFIKASTSSQELTAGPAEDEGVLDEASSPVDSSTKGLPESGEVDPPQENSFSNRANALRHRTCRMHLPLARFATAPVTAAEASFPAYVSASSEVQHSVM